MDVFARQCVVIIICCVASCAWCAYWVWAGWLRYCEEEA